MGQINDEEAWTRQRSSLPREVVPVIKTTTQYGAEWLRQLVEEAYQKENQK